MKGKVCCKEKIGCQVCNGTVEVLIGLGVGIRERKAGYAKLTWTGQVRDVKSWEH
jgi:hypothetical protein